jgi:hypothetical protein
MLMSTGHFRSQTGVRLKSVFMKGKSSDELIAIHKGLDDLQSGTYPKFDPQARWKHMMWLAGRCESYIKRKEAKGRNLTKPKHRCIEELSAQCVVNMVKEMAKSTHYGRQVSQYDRVAGLPMGRNNPGHGKVKFELALGGKGGPVVNGQSLWEAAHRAGINLTGNDSKDAYILRSWLKSLARANQLAKHTLTPLEYANSEQRQQYQLTFDGATCSQGTTAFNTTQSYVEGEEGACPFVTSEDGEWYAKAGNFTDTSFHHSSFLSGAPVMLAGTIRVRAGTLQCISNSSGHYAPKIADLLNGCEQLLHSGLNEVALAKVSVLALDFEGRYGVGGGAKYLFPMMLFARTGGAVPNPENYRTTEKFSELYWTNPDAARPGHPATIGKTDHNGALVAFPA